MITRARYVTIALATLVLASPRARAQQQLDWSNYCTLGPQLCFSISVGLTPTAAGTAFDISLRNLEGYLGTMPFAMWSVDLFDLATNLADVSAVPTRSATLNGTAGLIVTDPNSPICQIQGGCPNPSWGQSEWDWLVRGGRGAVEQTAEPPLRPFAIVGCDVPQVDLARINPAPGYFQTCGNGSIGFSFVLPGNWAFDDQSSVSFNYATGGSAPQFGCVAVTSQQPDFNNQCLPATATPEPATLMLLATGLVPLAGFARARRRARG